MDKINISPGQVSNAVWSIAVDIQRSDWTPDIIVGLSRGGLIPAVMLSHAMNIPMMPLKWSTRDYPGKDSLESLRQYKNILIVDDICDTGITLTEILHDLKIVAPITKVKTAVLMYKHIQPYRPDYHVFNIYEAFKDSWVEFYWENLGKA